MSPSEQRQHSVIGYGEAQLRVDTAWLCRAAPRSIMPNPRRRSIDASLGIRAQIHLAKHDSNLPQTHHLPNCATMSGEPGPRARRPTFEARSKLAADLVGEPSWLWSA